MGVFLGRSHVDEQHVALPRDLGELLEGDRRGAVDLVEEGVGQRADVGDVLFGQLDQGVVGLGDGGAGQPIDP